MTCCLSGEVKRMADRKSTGELDKMLGRLNPDRIPDYLSEQAESMYEAASPFSSYMKEMFRKKGFAQQEVFLRADMPERYGYKIISLEKHTVQRDVVIKLCIAALFNLTETNRALKLYGFSQLYSRIPRDAVIIVAINSRMKDIDEINDLLKTNNFEPLYSFNLE